MSLLLSILWVFMLPGCLMMAATLMLFVVGTDSVYKNVHHRLFIVWLGWAFVCGLLSQHVEMAIYGYAWRMEGWLTWLILARLAWMYWEQMRDLRFITFMAVLGLGIVAAASLDWVAKWHNWFRDFSEPRIALGGFIGMAGVLLWIRNRFLVLLTIPFLFMADSRSCVLGMIAGILVWEISEAIRKKKTDTGEALSWLIVICGVIVLLCPLAFKFTRIDPATLGTGARAQWALQAQWLIKQHPIKGYGLDTLATVLWPPSGRGHELAHQGGKLVDAICDKTHNIILDILLMTGWPGLILCLLTFGSALGTAWLFPTASNRACISGMIAWIVMGLVNPQGIPAHFLMLVCLIGINEQKICEE